MPKKTIRVKVAEVAQKVADALTDKPAAVNSRLENFKKLLEEAKKSGTLQKIEEYRFWVETVEGRNPPLPKHMR